MADQPSALLERGTVLGRYTILRCLGIGGMGAVYAAHDRELDREVALKLLRDPALLAMQTSGLRREATAMAKISDSAVVHVYEVGSIDGQAFVAMELIDGMNLREWCKEPRRWQDVAKIMVAAGRGLIAAHDAGVIHRDVKPDNVLIGRNGRVCVVDFGLARRLSEPSGAPSASGDGLSSTYAGTPAYMAPELHLGRHATPASDQFGYCVTFWEALFGCYPFSGSRGSDLSTAPTVALAIIGNRIEDVENRRGVSPRLIEMLRRGLLVDPALRWPSMAALVAAIQGEIDRPRRTRRIARAAVVAGVVAALGVAGFAWARSRASRIEIAYDRARRVTFAEGCESHPVFVPGHDGEILYARRVGPSASLHSVDGSGGHGDSLGSGASPAMSPDGRHLAALDRSDVVVQDMRGTAAPRRVGISSCGPAWLNERELVVCTQVAASTGERSAVVARPLAGGDDRVLGMVPPSTRARAVTVGSDGRIFAIHRTDGIAESVLVEIVPGAPPRELRRGVLAGAGVRYRAGANRVYFVQRMNSTQYHLFAQPADRVVEPTSLASDTPAVGGFDITPDGRQLVLSTCREVSSLVRIDRDGRMSQVTPRSSWRDNAPRIIDPDRFVYTSTRGGELQIWLHDRASDRALSKPESAYPAVSPDRETLAYAVLDDAAKSGLVARPLASDQTRWLTRGHVDRAPQFTHDGSALLFLRDTAAGLRLYRVALAGGAAAEVLPGEVRVFDVSPVGDAIAAVMPVDGRDRLRIGPAGELREVPGDALGARLKAVRFSRDGRAVLVVNGDNAILEVDLASGRAQTRWQIEGSEHASVGELDYDADGQAIIVGMVRLDGDLWVLEGRF